MRRRVAAFCYSTPAGPEKGRMGVGVGSEDGPAELNHTTRFLPLTPPDLGATGPARPRSSPRPKKDEASASADGPISSESPRHRRKIDFRAPLNGFEHIVLLCLCKAALNYSVCLCAASVCPCARVLEPHANWPRLSAMGKVTS